MKQVFLVVSMISCLYGGALMAQHSFTTLDDIVLYAQKMPEYPKSDTTDWHQPDYSSFHRALMPGLFDRFLHWIGFIKDDAFPMQSFQELLYEVTRERRQRYPQGRLIQKIEPKSDSLFIIWGELNGAFHSLVRDLQELKRLNIIDDTLKVQAEQHYLVFNGDVVGRSPYIIETLMVILLLMKQNPRNVIYIKGAEEDKQRWKDGALARELSIRAVDSSAEKIPFEKELHQFFATLPVALYLVPAGQKGITKEVVRISHVGAESYELNEADYAYFFDVYPENVVSILKKEQTLRPTINVQARAYISVEDRVLKYSPSQGLLLQGVTPSYAEWTVVSSPTASFRRLYEFFNDAFVLLRTAEQLSDWTLQLYYQDVRQLNGFSRGNILRLTSGQRYQDVLQKEIASLQQEYMQIQQENRLLRKECMEQGIDSELPKNNNMQ